MKQPLRCKYAKKQHINIVLQDLGLDPHMLCQSFQNFSKDLCFVYLYDVQSAKISMVTSKWETILVLSKCSFNLLCFIFGISSLLLLFQCLTKHSFCSLNYRYSGGCGCSHCSPLKVKVGVVITIQGAIQNRSYGTIYKTDTKKKAKRSRATTLSTAKLEE